MQSQSGAPQNGPVEADLSGVPTAVGHVVQWAYAMDVQAERIESAGTGPLAMRRREIDVRFFVQALRNLLRAIELIQRRASDAAREQIAAALEAFNQEVPGAKDVRDRLEHFDEYESGVGKDQRKAGVTEPSITFFASRPGRHAVTVLVPGLTDATVEVQAAKTAADRLQTAVCTAVDA